MTERDLSKEYSSIKKILLIEGGRELRVVRRAVSRLDGVELIYNEGYENLDNYNLAVVNANWQTSSTVFEDNRGIAVAKILKRQNPNLPVMIVGTELTVPLVMDAMKNGHIDDALHLRLLLDRDLDWFSQRIKSLLI